MPRKILGVGGGNSLPALSDNGTVVTSTEVLRLPDGTVSAPAISFTADTATGLYSRGGASNHQLVFSNNNANDFAIGSAARQMLISSDYQIVWSTTVNALAGVATIIRSRTAGNITLGATDINGTPVDQTIGVQNAITGSNLPGGHTTIDAPLGTGTGATSKISINRALMGASGGTAQTSTNAWAVGQSKTLSNTSATAQTIATITLGSNAGGGCAGTFTLVATDGTNFDSETQSFNVSFVNKAGAITVGSVVATASTAANNSGSATLGITAVANGNNIDIKVTPVFTTIVPTTVTLYPVISHSTSTVTFA